MYYKLHGATKDYIWGGNRLADYGYPGDRIAEAWVLSLHPDGMASIDGRPANEVLTRADWGSNCDRFEMFPVLVKLIDAKSDLSVQVHPSDAYALATGTPGRMRGSTARPKCGTWWTPNRAQVCTSVARKLWIKANLPIGSRREL